MTSGCHCTPYNRRSSSSKAATGAPALDAVTFIPAGTAVTESPWDIHTDCSTLFNGQVAEQSVWMSHGDSVTAVPAGMKVTASSAGAPVAAFEDDERRLYGVQWHPEVIHSTYGQRVLENFLIRGAGLAADWTASNVVEDQVTAVREQIGTGRVLCALSGE